MNSIATGCHGCHDVMTMNSIATGCHGCHDVMTTMTTSCYAIHCLIYYLLS